LIQTFKILIGIEKIDLNAPVKLTPSLASSGPAGSLRWHKISIEMEIIKNCDQRKHFLTNRVAIAWRSCRLHLALIVLKQKLIKSMKQIQKEQDPSFSVYLFII
jgi:hypothetical protein